MTQEIRLPPAKAGSRRTFLKAAGAAAAGGTLGFPMIAKAQASPISMRWQSTWPSKDIFHEFALDYAKKVNDMTGGELKIEVLPAGAVVPAFGLLDAVSKGHARRRPRRARLSLRQAECASAVGIGPRLRHGRQHAALLAQVRRRQGTSRQALFFAHRNVVSFPYGPHPTQPLGWFKKPVTKVDDFKGLEYRTVGISIDLFTGDGRRRQCAPRRRDRSGDGPRPARRGRVQQRLLRPSARLPRRVQGVHAAELPPERRAVRDHVQQDASTMRCPTR